MARDYAKRFYKSKGWERVRKYVIRRDKYLCVKCGDPAEEVHHVKKLSPDNINNPRVALNPDNLQSLCRDCHFDEHRVDRNPSKDEAGEGMVFDDKGYLVPRV